MRTLKIGAMMVVFLLASFVPRETVRADNQFFSEPCGNGEEVIIFGVSVTGFQLVVEIGTYNDQHYFYREHYADPGEEYMGWMINPIKIGEINSWERVKGLGVWAPGASHVWFMCENQDEDQEFMGPIYRG